MSITTVGDVTSAASRRVRRGSTAVGGTLLVMVVVAVTALTARSSVGAQGLPLCGGNQTDHPAPLTCSNSRLIDGTTFTVVLDVTANGVATVTYTLDTPRPADTPIRARWHVGISSGPLAAETSGTIPAGSTGPVTLSLTNNDCGGQIDMKAVFTGNGDSRGRIGAPLVSIPNCGTTTTTTATTTTTTTSATTTTTTTTATTTTTTTTATTIPTTATTVPPSTSGTAVVTSIPSNVNVETVTSPPLPSTGGTEISAAGIAVVALAVGCLLVVVTRRRLTDDLPD